jgi:hypothetical protein
MRPLSIGSRSWYKGTSICAKCCKSTQNMHQVAKVIVRQEQVEKVWAVEETALHLLISNLLSRNGKHSFADTFGAAADQRPFPISLHCRLHKPQRSCVLLHRSLPCTGRSFYLTFVWVTFCLVICGSKSWPSGTYKPGAEYGQGSHKVPRLTMQGSMSTHTTSGHFQVDRNAHPDTFP